MGSGEMGTSTKTTKTSTPQEQTPVAATTTSAMSYPEWAAALQAYYGSGMSPLPHPGYYPSTMGSAPQPHPYMWGAQPMVPPPFGTPPPYAALYPHGGMYGHPPMTPQVATSVGTDAEAKSDEKKKARKKSKGSLGSLGMLTGKTSDMSKANATSINGALSNSGDSGSEGSSDGSEGLSGEGSQELRKNSFDQATSEVPNSHMISPYGSAQDPMGNHAQAAMPISIGGKQVVGAGPVTNLNIGMDYWSGGTPGLLANNRGGKRASMAGNTTALIPSTANTMSGELWMQDERELKKQRRKQSNRESARRSRLRKQAECEELATKVQSLTAENASLREELNRMTEECNKLSAENSSLLDQLHMPRSEGLHGELTKMSSNLSKSDVLGDGLQLDHDAL
ncbi:hypothetical protein L7F22_028306 [Adiantum nelumboides]|nr:hypothetical protein [Adiantum nelumboides]